MVEDIDAITFDEFIIRKIENFGFPRRFVDQALAKSEMNQATTSYYLLHNAIYEQ